MVNIKHSWKWVSKNMELLFWPAALVLLFFMHTDSPQQSLCFFRFIGLQSCPGCGIGHAIHEALHLRFSQSFQAHFFGIPAVAIILHRIYSLTKQIKTPLYEI